jgi:endoglucanase
MKRSFSQLGTAVSLVLALAAPTACLGGTGESRETELATLDEACGAKQLFAPRPPKAAKQQVALLKSEGKKVEAALISKMIETPHAVWLVQGTPKEVKQQARQVVSEASDKGRVPVFVAYNIPFRDCAQFSAGGATTKQAYLDWIDGVAKGIGSGEVIVILEPDGLGIIPWYNPFGSRESWLPDPNVLEWCQPSEADPATAASDRFEMLSYAVTALKANPNTKVYLDGTHTGWLGAGDAADRLLQANVKEADGFFLNVSNYQESARLEKYGAWVSKCIWFADPESGSWGGGHSEWCASQYSPADPNDFSTWSLTDQWYADNVESQSWVPYPGAAGLEHFVIDTSRNGQGPWTYAGAPGDIQDWCNPPDRGVGERPTLNTGDPLLDAYLWVKVPGESDGQCNRWEPPGSEDPVRGMMNPSAGEWFPEMALELATNASPPL